MEPIYPLGQSIFNGPQIPSKGIISKNLLQKHQKPYLKVNISSPILSHPMKPFINFGLLSLGCFAVAYAVLHGNHPNVPVVPAAGDAVNIPVPPPHMPPAAAPAELPHYAGASPLPHNSRPSGKINGKNLMYNVIHFLLRASAQLNPLSLGIGTMLDGGANSSAVVTASEYGIKPVTNLVEFPPVHGQHFPTEYQYLIKMNPEDLHGQMVALFGELENPYELKEEPIEENSKKYKQMATINLTSCSIEKGQNSVHDLHDGEKICEITVKLSEEQILQLYWGKTIRQSVAWRKTHLKYYHERRLSNHAVGGSPHHNRRLLQNVHNQHRKLLQLSSVTITITNQCDFPAWPGVQCTDSRYSLPANGGLGRLDKGQSVPLVVAGDISALRIWPRMGCDDNGENCSSGQCGGDGIHCEGTGGQPPMTLGEFTLGTANGDFFDVSLVDGLNVPMTIIPSGGTGDKCRQIRSCDLRTLTDLPEKMLVKNSDGITYLVKSPCGATGDPALCCAGQFGTPDACHPVYKDYSVYNEEKALCPDQYLYPYDDETSTFVCNGHTDYEIKLCPT